MNSSNSDLYTQYFYEWEERGRGWALYNRPVCIEPPFEIFNPPVYKNHNHSVDDGKVPNLLERFQNFFKSSENPTNFKEQITSKAYYSYPDNPVLFDTTSDIHVYQVHLPKTYSITSDEMRAFIAMLSCTEQPLSFEIIGYDEKIIIQFTCRNGDRERFISQFNAYFQGIGIEERDDIVSTLSESKTLAIIDFGLSEEFMIPLVHPQQQTIEPLKSIFGILDHLQDDEFVMMQVLFHGSRNAWAKEIVYSVSDGVGGSFFIDAPEMPSLASEKVSSPIFGAVIRTVIHTKTKDRSNQIYNNILQSIRGISHHNTNSLIPLSNDGYTLKEHLKGVLNRHSNRLGMILNANELLQWVQIPDTSIQSRHLEKQNIRSKKVPKEFRNGTYNLGINKTLTDEQPVFIPDSLRLRHTHIIGATGTGKSNLLKNLILQDVKANIGCTVIDPHGDLIDTIMKHIPESKIDDVILVDPSDAEYPIGLNLFQAQTEAEKMMLSSDLLALFKEHATSWGDQMTGVLANAINAILESTEAATLHDLRRFLVEKEFRASFLETVHDPAVRYYWENEFPLLKNYSLMPLLTRLDMFMRPRVIRNMLSQKKGLNFSDILNSGKILLIKLPQGLIGEDNSYLLGTLFVSKLYQAALGRQAIKNEQRKPHFLYLDEFQHFMTPSLQGILSGTRKYGLGMVLAHQDLSQLMYKNSELGSAVLSNPAVRVCFRVGDMDARKLEDGFEYFEASDLQSLGIGQAIVRLGSKMNDCNITVPLIDEVKEVLAQVRKNKIIDNSRSKYASGKVEAIQYLYDKDSKKACEITDKKPVKKDILEKQATKSDRPEKTGVQNIEVSSKKFIEAHRKKKEETLHRSIQKQVKQLAESFGFKATIEEALANGGRVDVGLRKDDIRIAVEISVTNTADYEVSNILKCIESGYSHVLIYSDKPEHSKEIKRRFKKHKQLDNKANVQFVTMQQMTQLFHQFFTKDQKQKRVKGYRVKVNYKRKGE
jgi:hypothetical protein